MKITITTDIETSPEFLKVEIAGKLNKLIDSTINFFFWKTDALNVGSCSNCSMHNKLIILLAMFTDSNNEKYGTFTSFNSIHAGISFENYNTIEKLVALNRLVDSIPNLKEVKFEFN